MQPGFEILLPLKHGLFQDHILPKTCTFCDKIYTSSQAKNLHFRKYHLGGKYDCQLCDGKFTAQGYLLKHLNVKHRNSKSPVMKGIYLKKLENKSNDSTVEKGGQDFSRTKTNLSNQEDMVVDEILDEEVEVIDNKEAKEKQNNEEAQGTLKEGLAKFECPHCKIQHPTLAGLRIHISKILQTATERNIDCFSIIK